MTIRSILLIGFTLLALALATKNRFDVAYLWCSKDSAGNLLQECPAKTSSGTCMCEADIDELNSVGNHYLGMKSPATIPIWDKIKAAGNSWAYLLESIAAGYPGSGAAYADKVYAQVQLYARGFSAPVPKYFLLNEISFSGWAKKADYRKFVIDLATQLKKHGVTPVVFSPWLAPATTNKVSWTALAKVAFIAAEAYLDSVKIGKVAANKRYAYMLGEYKKSVNAYAKNGVPKSRLALFEHYGHTTGRDSKGRKIHYGRLNVPSSTWRSIIVNRNKAFKALKVWGTGSYGWQSNPMNVAWGDRAAFYALYNKGAAALP